VRSLATSVLVDYAGDQPALLAGLLGYCQGAEFDLLFGKLAEHPDRAASLLEAVLEGHSPEATNEANRETVEDIEKRRANAAVALVRLGRPERVWPLLRHGPDPGVRSSIVNRLKPLRAKPRDLATRLERLSSAAVPTPRAGQSLMDAILFHPETSERRALILALGEFEAEDLPPGERGPLAAKLLGTYRTDPDAGVHAAAEWTLRRWGQQETIEAIDAELKGKDRGDRRWYVNGEGLTLAVIEGPVEFRMGSPAGESDRLAGAAQRRRRIERRFAIATKEVTAAQYRRFLEANPTFAVGEDLGRSGPDPSGPSTGRTWYEAAAYCNWLSRREGLEECYRPNADREYAEGMEIVADFQDRPGYRLPTEAEWEYACRAGATTSRYHGRSTELLGHYAWFNRNSQEHAWPCGQAKPNDLGLFDMLGNVYEWCLDDGGAKKGSQSPLGNYPDDIIRLLSDKEPRVLRGGSFDSAPTYVRSAYRRMNAPSFRLNLFGFRLAWTLPDPPK
jgi:formylglycine-generating enzyme required for sulfatase activity